MSGKTSVWDVVQVVERLEVEAEDITATDREITTVRSSKSKQNLSSKATNSEPLGDEPAHG